MKLIDPNTSPPSSILIEFWRFIKGKIELKEFEKWVYNSYDELKELLDEPSFFKLVCFNFPDAPEVEVGALKADLKSMLEFFPTKCECIKFADYEILDSGFFNHLTWCEEVIEYFENQFTSTFELLKVDVEKFSGYKKKIQDECYYDFLYDPMLYQCKECGNFWLVIFNETEVNYHIIHLSKEEAMSTFSDDSWFKKLMYWFNR